MYRIKTTVVAVMLLLCMKTYGQTLKVGDKAPPITAFKWVKGIPVSEPQKGKVYVVEFGATWCKPCIAAIPHLTALADKYKGEVEVVSFFVMELNNEPEDTKNPIYVQRVEQFVARQGNKMGYTVAVDDPQKTMEHTWIKASGLTGVPQTFIVDKEGFIAWIGFSTEFSKVEEVVAWVNSDKYKLSKATTQNEAANKLKVVFDPARPLLIDGNGGEDNDYLFRSLISKSKHRFRVSQQPLVSSRGWFHDSIGSYYPKRGRVQWVNMSLFDLYNAAYGDTLVNMVYSRDPRIGYIYPDTIQNPYNKRAYGKYWYDPIPEVAKPERLEPTSWRNRWSSKSSLENKYDYSIEVPEKKATAQFVQEVMQRDLKNYFGYDVAVETRMMPYWKLTASAKAKRLLKTATPGEKYRTLYTDSNNGSTVFKNAVTRDLIWMLGSNFGYQWQSYDQLPLEDQAPFIDETGLDIQIDFVMSKENQTDFQGFKQYLESKGLKLEKSTKPMKVVVIRDPENKNNLLKTKMLNR